MTTEVLSVGYERRKLDVLCDQLAAAGVEVFLDVRERAWSQRPDFRKGKLSDALAARGIEYRHVRSAGNPHRPTKDLVLGRDACMALYREHIRENQQVLDELAGVLKANRCAMFCYERHTEDCHRGVLLEELADRMPGLATLELED